MGCFSKTSYLILHMHYFCRWHQIIHKHFHCDPSLRRTSSTGLTSLTGLETWELFSSKRKKLEVLEHPLPNEPARNATNAQRGAFDKRKNDSNDVTCLMLATMSPKLQKQFVDMEAFEIMTHLKEMFQEQARHERFVTTRRWPLARWLRVLR